MCLMHTGMEVLHCFAATRIGLICKKKTGNGPDGIQLGFAINQMLKIGGYLEVFDDAAQRIGREILHPYDVGWVYVPDARNAIVTVQAHDQTTITRR